MPHTQAIQMEFHVSRQARDRYQFDEALFSLTGNVIFANFHGARQFAQAMNSRRDLVNYPERAVRAGEINAMGLIDEISHYVVAQYRRERNPQVFAQALARLREQLTPQGLEQTLRLFVVQFPPLAVYRRELGVDEYLAGSTGGVSNQELALEELLMLWVANMNPAFAPYLELYDDADLERNSAYLPMISTLREFFAGQPGTGADNQSLIDLLRAPALAFPNSLLQQLEFMRERWGVIVGQFIYRLLSSLDLVKEETKAIFSGPGPARAYDFTGSQFEPEAFSPDRDWMPNLVLIAKNSYVWLDQLSKKYKRSITHLDQIPEIELETLSKWGITGLWLIGLWERSLASQRIKVLRGNPEAVASAYSLMSYDIANDLGGDEAYQGLREKAWRYGIRLASDMVPNHMGIDSRWVIEHPDWFISLPYPPFPAYTFNSENLSWDERVALNIEDHYFNNTDASVVFKRTDKSSGDTRYIYHGNDGTSMPWNDTAQLNYLMPEVREAVIQTILHVARKFPVIRFDAAMTLAKKHYQRLWFPEPGSGGDIPTRAGFGLTKEQFDAAFPQEFWREVVDRVAQEVPDTLLLAEAFWLMEGYFVRTLGMHRVYNSAFMNMLRDEKNQEYRQAIKNTVEFEPEILKRYVNFMNNPDERTAVDQFGKGDKYFGIATMMATMPGLPMIGHGQVEGFTEKYGMEYRRAYWEEQVDSWLVERHNKEVFPLLRKRYLFADVRDFRLYDFYTPGGSVDENVFAYSNRAGEERALVVYHNKYAETSGWIRISAAYLSKKANSDERGLVQSSLGEGMGLANDPDVYIIFKDQYSGLEYIRNSRELHTQGLFLELGAYRCQVFVDFRQLPDNIYRQYSQLANYLGGRGVPSVEVALKEIFLQPIHHPFHELVNAGFYRWLVTNRAAAGSEAELTPVLGEAEEKTRAVLQGMQALLGKAEAPGNAETLSGEIKQDIEVLLRLPALADRLPSSSRKARAALKQMVGSMESGDARLWGVLNSFVFTRRLGELAQGTQPSEQSRTWLDEWLLGRIIERTLVDLGMDLDQAGRAVSALKLVVGHQGWFKRLPAKGIQPGPALQAWLKDAEVQRFLGVNRHQGVLWFRKESFDELLNWMFAEAVFEIASRPEITSATLEKGINQLQDLLLALRKAEAASGYQVEKLLEAAA